MDAQPARRRSANLQKTRRARQHSLRTKPRFGTLITEQSGTASQPLDTLSTLALVQRIHAQDASVAHAVKRTLPQIAAAVDAAVDALRNGGRLFYVGAGTSGRLGVLDAAECPPTFGVSPQKVQAIIAGGTRALLRAAEAAEDDAQQAARDLAARKIGPRDVVVGLSASGRTPYTVGALEYARGRGAVTVAVACNAGSPLEECAHIAIVPRTGPEILSGSTRLKAGLAQKMVLHTISTATLTRLGHVYNNLMVGVRPTNEKLVARACRIISEITGASPAQSAKVLRQSGNDVRTAIVMLAEGLSRTQAKRLLKQHAGNLRAAL